MSGFALPRPLGVWPERKCSECPVVFRPRAPKQRTCGDACKRARQARRAAEAAAWKARAR